MPANRLLALAGTDVKLVDTVAVGDGVSQVAFTPGGKRALATKFSANKLPLFAVDGDKVSPAKLDLPTGPSPHNVAVPPDGSIALTADNGGGDRQTADTVSVVDLQAEPPGSSIAWWSATAPKALPSLSKAIWRSPRS